jgi:hypothetical protein
LELLERIRRGHPPRKDDIVFGGLPGKALADRSLAMALRRVSGGDCTVHGMRSAFRDWAVEHGVQRETAEACLAHQLAKNAVEGAYLRSDLLLKRRPVMQAWADFIAGHGADNIVALRR